MHRSKALSAAASFVAVVSLVACTRSKEAGPAESVFPPGTLLLKGNEFVLNGQRLRLMDPMDTWLAALGKPTRVDSAYHWDAAGWTLSPERGADGREYAGALKLSFGPPRTGAFALQGVMLYAAGERQTLQHIKTALAAYEPALLGLHDGKAESVRFRFEEPDHRAVGVQLLFDCVPPPSERRDPTECTQVVSSAELFLELPGP